MKLRWREFRAYPLILRIGRLMIVWKAKSPTNDEEKDTE